MPWVGAHGVNINFPFEPYPCQDDYMKKVVECLQKDQNGILESPTGTGKTLCLLCSTLAWLEDKKSQVSLKQNIGVSSLMKDDDVPNAQGFDKLAKSLVQATGSTWGGMEFAIPKVIYASRTHSQLSQAIQELKRTAYNQCELSASVISRLVSHAGHTGGADKVHMCRNKVNARTCHYYNHTDEMKKNGDLRQSLGTVADIEDLVKFGEKNKCCPYYMARELKSDADIIFMPYNYLLDPKSRKAHGVELQGNIVIFDEAHNLEKICEESASFDLTSTDLATAIEEVTMLAEKLVDYAQSDLQSIELSTDNSIVPDFTLDDLLRLKATIKELEQHLDDIDVPTAGITHPGIYIFELLGKVNVTFETKNLFMEVLDKIISYLNSDGTSSSLHTKGAGLTKFADMLKIVFSREMQDGISLLYHQKTISHSYRVHIHKQENIGKKKKTIDVWATAGGGTEKTGRVLSYWCFSPGHSMSDMVTHGVKCIILTSGTLSPISSFTAEMQISFPVQLENPHVIEKHQVWIGTLSKGPDGTILNSSYENRSKESYQSSLGNSIVNFARVVPNGLLIFFPSYPVMDKCLENWKNVGIWNRITHYKPIFVEPKGKAAFQEAMEEFYEKINDVSLNGAIFAAVCRGKVSEGLDFSDINGRAVVITGLPFPPMMDPKIILKMKFLDESKGKQGFKSLGGREWYRQQATRAVNQAIGRVIRHKEDFGAIILCDNRFSSAQSMSQFPVWVRPYVNQYSQFGGAIRDLMMFFKTAEKVMPAARPPKQRINNQQSGGAYFLPSTSRRGQGFVEQAKTVTNHVPSLKQREEDVSSLSKLKIQYEGTSKPVTGKLGLLDALDCNEHPQDDEIYQVHSTLTSYRQPTSKTGPTRKKIIIKKPGQSMSEVTKSQIVDNQSSVTSSGLQSAESYIAEVRKTLGQQSYKVFSQTLGQYKKTEDFTTLTATLADLFTDDPANYPLFRKFYKFVRPRHKEQFHQLCKDITGEGCSFKPEHSLSKKRISKIDTTAKCPPDKRQKLGPLTNKADDNTQPSTMNTIYSNTLKVENIKSNLHDYTSSNSVNLISLDLKKSDNKSSIFTNFPSDSQNSMTTVDSTSLSQISSETDENRESRSSSQSTGIGGATGNASSEDLFSQDRMASTNSSRSGIHKSIPKSNALSGYTCCKCKEDAKTPFQAGCTHICCFLCWKGIIKDTKTCPQCGQAVRRRDMKQLYFPSGPNIDNDA